jgi:prolyl oligopeptidase
MAFYNDELYLRGKPTAALSKVDVPNSAQKSAFRTRTGWCWNCASRGRSWLARPIKPGSLIVTDFNAFMAGKRDFDVLFEPGRDTFLAGRL